MKSCSEGEFRKWKQRSWPGGSEQWKMAPRSLADPRGRSQAPTEVKEEFEEAVFWLVRSVRGLWLLGWRVLALDTQA